ncbi:P-loop NTPase [Thermodesulfobacteriota bacterium]
MGLFHCPLGAIYRDDEPCIDCGLCEARTKEEAVEASKKIREYLQAHAARPSTVKKIAICGKGGVGKSTVVTLMTNVLREERYQILTVDTDESNPGLGRMLGIDGEPTPLVSLLGRLTEEEEVERTGFLARDEITVSDIPKEFFIEKNNLKFLITGKIIDPFEGCACSMADVVREFLIKLILQEKEMVVIDMEAGVESFGRGVERSVDTVLTIVEPSFESIALAEKIKYMADGIGVATVRALLNKIPNEEIEKKIRDKLREKNIDSLGTIYYNLEVNEAGFEGYAIGDSQAKEDMRSIVRTLLN